MISQDDLARIEVLRAKVFAHIKKSLEASGHCKSYEGRFHIVLPHYFEPNGWRLDLHCYLIGPTRHYEWRGDSLSECIDKAEKDINYWTSRSTKRECLRDL